VAVEVRFLLVLLDGVAFAAAVAFPVDVADVVARNILAVLDELDGEPFVGALVVADAETFDELPRLHSEGFGASENIGL
jgi:hypothetical protein